MGPARARVPSPPEVFSDQVEEPDEGEESEEDKKENERVIAEAEAEEAARNRTFDLSGHWETRVPTGEGRLFSISYLLRTGPPVIIEFDHGSYPAPGRTILTEGGLAEIGSASMCTVRVEIHEHPTNADAVSVGENTWFLTKEACIAVQGSQLADTDCRSFAQKTTALVEERRGGNE